MGATEAIDIAGPLTMAWDAVGRAAPARMKTARDSTAKTATQVWQYLAADESADSVARLPPPRSGRQIRLRTSDVLANFVIPDQTERTVFIPIRNDNVAAASEEH